MIEDGASPPRFWYAGEWWYSDEAEYRSRFPHAPYSKSVFITTPTSTGIEKYLTL